MERSTAITLAVAVLGAVLGLINTWRAMSQDRLRLRVVPKMAFAVGPWIDERVRPCIEIVNMSTFPVTIRDAGFVLKEGEKRMVPTTHAFLDGSSLPKRLESRSACTVYFAPDSLDHPDFQSIRCAFARTDCGHEARGKSGALRSLTRDWAKHA